jgi:photosystem II stability/assembly factor-like uncharacterized protein
MKNLLLTIVSVLLASGFLTAQRNVNDSTAWVQQTADTTDNFHKVIFTDTLTGWIAGEQFILQTLNGGEKWSVLYGIDDTNQRILDFFTLDGKKAWMIVEEDTLAKQQRDNNKYDIYLSNDSSQTWTNIYSNDEVYMQKLLFVNDTQGWFIGSNYSIYGTTDGGQNWEMQHNDTLIGLFKDIQFLNDTLGFVVGDNSKVMQTSDAGLNWSATDTLPAYSSLSSVFAFSETNIWVGGSIGRIFHSIDGGQNWNMHQIDYSDYIYDLLFKTENIGWACSANGKLNYLTDGDTNWTSDTLGLSNLYSMCFVNEDQGWIVGSNSLILKTTNGGGEVGINEINSNPIQVQAYPNPSSGILTVELLPSSENMTIRLVNLYGQILVEKEIQTTQKSIKFEIDLTNLSNAMYLLSISDKTNSKTIKIIKKD